MATAIMAALGLLTAASGNAQHAETILLRDMLVTARGDPAGLPYAGIFAPYIGLEGIDPAGEAMVLYLLRMAPADPAPPLGSVCTFEAEQRPLLPGRLVLPFRDTAPPTDDDLVLVIDHFDCRITSDSPVID